MLGHSLKPAGRSDGYRKGSKCILAALAFYSERNYKCIRGFKSTIPFPVASPAKWLRVRLDLPGKLE
jgi:hypothetical protein